MGAAEVTDPMAAWLARRGRDHLRRPRWIQHAWAGLLGYFWTSCPECGRMFGGHETARGAVSLHDPDQPGRGFVVCRGCGPVVAERTWREWSERVYGKATT